MGIAANLPSIKVLGVRVNMVQVPDVLALMEHWIEEKDRCHYIVATGMHGVMEARRDLEFLHIVESADLFVPDGISLIWTARLRGVRLKRRVCGIDIMAAFFGLAEERGYSVFLYGDTEETLQLLTDRLKHQFPRLTVAGTCSPPFRPLTTEEKTQEIDMINASGADVVWIGLGLPKQERWMYEHKDLLNASVLVGVGAAFKFASGNVVRAPAWIGDHGFEWLWRLVKEPRQIWRRVLVDGPRFVVNIILEQGGLKKYD